MEYKVDDMISYNDEGKTIYLQVTPTRDITCHGCYFLGHKCHCSTIKNIVGECSKNKRTDKQTVIFTKVNNKIMKKKITIDIYVVMQTHKQYRSFCSVFSSFEEADARFEGLLNHYKNIHKIQPKGWTTKSIPSQIKVSVIGDITLYLCKETKEIEISEEVKEPIVDKPEFKPFFCANNCFKESIKHTPFGILKDSTDKYYTILDISEDGISVLSGNHSVDTISFKFASTFLKYVDGSPFGWSCES